MSNYLKFKEYLANKATIDFTKHIVCVFRLTTKVNFKEAAIAVAAESSIGTWTEVAALNMDNVISSQRRKELAAKIFYLSPRQKIVKIAYPLDLFEFGNISQFLSGCAGNIFSMKILDQIRLEDVIFPAIYVKSFLGPQLGLHGVRKIANIKKRPLVGAIIKPKIGLSAKQHARVAQQCFLGGIDLVKDDENLTDQTFNRFRQRVRETLKLARQVEAKTGHRKICVFNITASLSIMIKRAKYVKQQGGRCVMVDVFTAGFSALQELRKQKLGLIIHAHRAMHSAFTRNPKHGITMLVLAKLLRLVGVDQLHTGTVVGKMEGSKKDVLAINQFLTKSWYGLKPVMPIASGGLHPGLTPVLIKILGHQLIINFGGGLHGHPQGILAGAQAAYQSVIASYRKISLRTMAQRYPALKVALKYWSSK